jgi:hypothetical protein
MLSIPKQVLGAAFILVGITGFSGCASKEAETSSLKRLLAAKQARIEELKLTRADMQRVIDLKNAELARQSKDRMQAGDHSAMANATMGGDGAWMTASRTPVGGASIGQPVLCLSHLTPETVRHIQHALKQTYHYHGTLDGVFGPQTRRAVESYQRAKELAVDSMTLETLRSLGLKVHDQEAVAGAK